MYYQDIFNNILSSRCTYIHNGQHVCINNNNKTRKDKESFDNMNEDVVDDDEGFGDFVPLRCSQSNMVHRMTHETFTGSSNIPSADPADITDQKLTFSPTSTYDQAFNDNGGMPTLLKEFYTKTDNRPILGNKFTVKSVDIHNKNNLINKQNVEIMGKTFNKVDFEELIKVDRYNMIQLGTMQKHGELFLFAFFIFNGIPVFDANFDQIATQTKDTMEKLQDFIYEASNGHMRITNVRIGMISFPKDMKGAYTEKGKSVSYDFTKNCSPVEKKMTDYGVKYIIFKHNWLDNTRVTRMMIFTNQLLKQCSEAGIAGTSLCERRWQLCAAKVKKFDSFVVFHEFGHMLSFVHSGHSSEEYGDLYCIMGGGGPTGTGALKQLGFAPCRRYMSGWMDNVEYIDINNFIKSKKLTCKLNLDLHSCIILYHPVLPVFGDKNDIFKFSDPKPYARICIGVSRVIKRGNYDDNGKRIKVASKIKPDITVDYLTVHFWNPTSGYPIGTTAILNSLPLDHKRKGVETIAIEMDDRYTMPNDQKLSIFYDSIDNKYITDNDNIPGQEPSKVKLTSIAAAFGLPKYYNAHIPSFEIEVPPIPIGTQSITLNLKVK